MEYELHKALLDNRDSKIAELETALKAAEEKGANSVPFEVFARVCNNRMMEVCLIGDCNCFKANCSLIPKEGK
jgi:hypothetical protein